MNGPSRVQLQRRSGVREIVADLDQLKLAFPLQCIQILTPKAEVTLRLGKKAQIPFKILYQNLSAPLYAITLQYPMAYPEEPLQLVEIQSQELEQSLSDDQPAGALSIPQILQLGQDYSNSRVGDNGYTLDLISYLRSLLEPTQGQLDQAVPLPLQGLSEPPPQPYKCRQCRRALFYSSHIEHPLPSSSCSSIFLREISAEESADEVDQSVRWIEDVRSSASADGLSGKISCPSCHHKVGYWSWSGAKCSCGVWVVPSLQFTLARLDPPAALKDSAVIHPTSPSVYLPIGETLASVRRVSEEPPAASADDAEEGQGEEEEGSGPS
jgi:hypothetical protein